MTFCRKYVLSPSSLHHCMHAHVRTHAQKKKGKGEKEEQVKGPESFKGSFVPLPIKKTTNRHATDTSSCKQVRGDAKCYQ